jgi:hypothetical protein
MGGRSEPPYSLAPDAPAGSAVAPYTCTSKQSIITLCLNSALPLCMHGILISLFFMCGRGEIGFCKPECREDYILEELHRDQRRRRERAAGSLAPIGVRSRGRDGDTGSIFFTCVDDIL